MSLTRGQFLSRLASGAATLALSPRAFAVGPEGTLPATFQPLVGSVFSVSGLGHPASSDLTLLEVSDRTPASQKGARSPTIQFTLLFSSLEGASLPAGTYRAKQRALGEMDLYLQPAGTAANRATLYRADFNLLDMKKLDVRTGGTPAQSPSDPLRRR